MTHAAEGDLHEDLARLERRNVEIDDFERSGKFNQNGGGGFHVVDPDDGAIDERRLAKTRSGPESGEFAVVLDNPMDFVVLPPAFACMERSR